MSSAKEEVESLLDKLPDNCSLEDIQYHLYVIEKVRHGLEAADTLGTRTQEEAEGQLNKWLEPISSRQKGKNHEMTRAQHETILVGCACVARGSCLHLFCL